MRRTLLVMWCLGSLVWTMAAMSTCWAVRSGQQVQRVNVSDTMQFEFDAQGSKCDNILDKQMKETFKAKGRCRDQTELDYVNPAGVADVLYIYPKEDHNGAFSLCSSGTIDPSVCYRLVHMAHHYSVHFVRVASVQEATAYVKSLPATMRPRCKKVQCCVLMYEQLSSHEGQMISF